jgi:hypothetical protein
MPLHTESPPPPPNRVRQELRRLVSTVFEEWYENFGQTWATAGRIADGPAVTFDPDACREWLADGVADEHGIDDTFCTTELSIPAGLEALLRALIDNPQPQVWKLHPALEKVQIWRTADGDGVDGGAIITADLSIDGERVRLATLHQGFDDFTTDSATAGIEAAVEALDHVAWLVDNELAAHRRTTAPADGYTVIGDWDNEQPSPLGVLTGKRPGSSNDQRRGWWVIGVDADDPDEAKRVAVAKIRSTLTN